MNKKIVSKTKYIVSLFISFIVWSIVLWFLNTILTGLFKNIGDSAYLIYTYVIYVLECVIIIPLCYINNRKKRVAKYESEKTKIYALIMFYILFIGIAIDDITEGMLSSPMIFIPLIVAKVLLITFINELMFKRSMKDEEK